MRFTYRLAREVRLQTGELGFPRRTFHALPEPLQLRLAARLDLLSNPRSLIFGKIVKLNLGQTCGMFWPVFGWYRHQFWEVNISIAAFFQGGKRISGQMYKIIYST